ncbi:MAG: DUF2188 domain-containing protein [Steroidobacteraceae bacterium]|nr:DUF2188 domain-containing protein [Steroidobacteraceae bacterium]
MSSAEENDVYRISPGGADRWQVFREPSQEPLASFEDRAAALNYAMCLARGRVAWHLLLRLSRGSQKNAGPGTRNTHH